MTQPDPDKQRLRWVEQNAGVYDEDDEPSFAPHDDYDHDTVDWFNR